MTIVTLNEVAGMPALLTVAECCALMRVSKSVCYELVARKQIPSIRVSPRRILVPTERLILALGLDASGGGPSVPSQAPSTTNNRLRTQSATVDEEVPA